MERKYSLDEALLESKRIRHKVESGANNYSDAELQVEQELSESRRVAQEKLKKIKQNQFYDFGIRAMNLMEFRTVFQQGHLISGKEAYLPNHAVTQQRAYASGSKPISFKDYLNLGRAHDPKFPYWNDLINAQTNDDTISVNDQYRSRTFEVAYNYRKDGSTPEALLKSMRELKEEINKYYKEILDKMVGLYKLYESRQTRLELLGFDPTKIELIEEFLDRVPNSLNKNLSYGSRESVLSSHISNNLLPKIGPLKEEQHKFIIDLSKYVLMTDYFDEDCFEAAIKMSDSDNFVSDPKNLKQLLRLNLAMHNMSKALEGFPRNYDVAMVLDLSILGKGNYGWSQTFKWSQVRYDKKMDGDDKEKKERAGHILGIIVFDSDPIKIREIIDRISHAKDAACPVFSAGGTLLFPK